MAKNSDKAWIQSHLDQNLLTFRDLKLGLEWHQDTGLDLRGILEKILRKNQRIRTSVEQTATKERRSRRRFKRETNSNYVQLISSDDVKTIRLHNLSRGGVGFFNDQLIEIGVQINLRMNNENIEATVKNVIETDGGWLIGVEFVPSTLHDVYLHEELLSQLRTSEL